MRKAKYVIKNDRGLYYNEFNTFSEEKTFKGLRVHKFMETPNIRFSNKKFVMILIAVLRIVEGEICSIEEVRD